MTGPVLPPPQNQPNRPGPSPEPPKKPRPFTVSEVLRQLKSCLEDSFLPLAVRGEACDLRRPRGGHLYLNLRDSNARLKIVVFSSTLQKMPHQPREGESLVVWGRMSAYPASGQVQLIADGFEPAGLGARFAAREKLRKELAAEGLFARERKQAIPPFPKRIGLVTSTTGSAIHDVLSTLSRRFPLAEALVAPTRVNGANAAADISAAIRALDRRGECCVILVVRGGGSREDLAAFDEEILLRGIARCQTPIVTGVGHEDDTTLADLVADRRGPTPTGAAELAVPHRGELLEELAAHEGRLRRSLRERLTQASRRLDAAERSHALQGPLLRLRRASEQLAASERRLEQAHPAAQIRRQAQALDESATRLHRAGQERSATLRRELEWRAERLTRLHPGPRLTLLTQGLQEREERLQRSLPATLQREGERLAALAGRLEGLSPLRVLARGYSLTRTPAGQVALDAADLQVGDEIETRLAKGTIRSTVSETLTDPEQ